VKKNGTLKRFSMLSRHQQRIFGLGFFLGLAMLINTLYLLFSAHVQGVGKNPEVLPLFYQLMLVAHLVVGTCLVALAMWFVIWHIRKVLKRRRPRPWMRTTGSVLITSLCILLFSGFFILEESNSQENFWIFVSHQVIAAALVGAYLCHRFMSRVKPFVPAWLSLSPAKAATTSAIIIVGYIGLQSLQARGSNEALDQDTDVHQAQALETSEAETVYTFIAAGDPDLESPFFPATTTTTTGGWLPARIITHDDLPDIDKFQEETREKGFAPSYFLGAQSCQRCHADIVAQWSTSAHRFSSFNNPFYRKSVELTREKISKQASQFCGGCHDPAVMLAGNMVNDIDPLTPESQAGLTCLGCHAIDEVHGVVGNGNYNIHDKTESPYIFDQVKEGVGLEVHDYVLKAKPTVHKRRMLKPIFHESEFCLSCHKVNLDTSVNNYRWLRGQNEYDAWHNSGVARNQPKTWYEPPTVRECQDCHMPMEEAVLGDVAASDGMVRSHRFLAVNTALPAIRGDYDTIKRMEEDLRDDKLRLEIFAVRRENGELIMSARDHRIEVRPGEELQIDVVVRNLNVGHTFPGGTNDSNEGWIDFAVQSEQGTVFHNGWLGGDRHVDPAAHFYKAVLVDRYGERIAKRNASDIYAAVYANVIPPSTSDIARYRFTVPENVSGELDISAKLMWRKFNREYTEFVFEGQDVPNLPITEIEADTLTLMVKDDAEPAKKHAPLSEDEQRWVRYNDYGIGAVLDKDTRTALAAFNVVAQLQPEKMDGFFNQARAHITEGVLDKAESMLRKASERAPNEPRLAFFWGSLLEKQGRLIEAAEAFKRTLQSYPESRDTWVRLGRVYWLNGAYEDSIAAYKEVLKINPEHALAFYQLKLAYGVLAVNTKDPGEREKYTKLSAEYEKGFEKYKIDENAAAVTRQYRERHPYDNLMSQTIVIHEEG